MSTLVMSCGKEKDPTILSKAEMVKVLTEVYIAEDKINRLSVTPDSSMLIFEDFRRKISAKTGIPDSVFRKSFDYYTARPQEMEQIYTALVDSLNLKEQRSAQD